MRILLIEPYYGGSHRRFLEGLQACVPAEYQLLTLPARKWKMRMQLAAPWFIKQVFLLPKAERYFDCVLFSTFIDVAVFRALAGQIEGWNKACRYLSYYHENQFAYPGNQPKQTNHQFTAINFTTALVSDAVAFNSNYNRDSFFTQCHKFITKAHDIDLRPELAAMRKKSRVLYPGIDCRRIDEFQRGFKSSDSRRAAFHEPLIVWNHRWEHDKNPEEFFEALYRLHAQGIGFRLALLGERFKCWPSCFDQARERLGAAVEYFGYVEDKEKYYTILSQGDIVVSTARHEFYGISVLEAVRSGCYPVLPDRLSYPELFDSRFLYDDGKLPQFLGDVIENKVYLSVEESIRITSPYCWSEQAPYYEQWLNGGN